MWPQPLANPYEHRLFPDASCRVPGNAAPIILRLRWEKGSIAMDRLERSRESLNKPLAEMTTEQLNEASRSISPYDLAELKRAAHRRFADWEYWSERGLAGNTPLPDANGLRTIVGGLAASCRADIAAGRNMEAIEKLETGFGVLDHFGQTPFLVIQFVKASQERVLLDRVVELIQQPQAPNLYWALTLLPRPIIDLRDTLDCERAMVQATAIGRDDLEAPRSREEWEEAAERIIETFFSGDNSRSEPKQMVADLTARARDRLGQLQPRVADRVKQMSDAEAMVRYVIAAVASEQDQVRPWMRLPPPDALAHLEQHQKALDQRSQDLPESRLNVPYLDAYRGLWRLEQQIDALRLVEALRDFAARHDGKWPDELSDIQDVAVPKDPVTGRPFRYRVDDATAIVEGHPVGVPQMLGSAASYRIRLGEHRD